MAKCVGILTAGGDSPGLNAAIRAIGKILAHNNYRLIGFRDGFEGIAFDRTMLLEESNAFDTNRYKIYRKIFSETIQKHDIISENPYIALTEHIDGDNIYCVAINHSQNFQNPQFVLNGCTIGEVYYGSPEKINPFDAVVFKIIKK